MIVEKKDRSDGNWLNYAYNLLNDNDILEILELSDYHPKRGVVDIKEVNTKKYFNVTNLKSYMTEDSIYTDGRIVNDYYGKAIVEFNIALIFKRNTYNNEIEKIDIIINSDSSEGYERIRKEVLTKYINPCTFKFFL